MNTLHITPQQEGPKKQEPRIHVRLYLRLKLKGVKKWLEEQWDHRLLLSSDDPLLDEFRKIDELGGCNINVMDVAKGYGPGIEQSCKFVYDHVNPMIIEATDGKAWLEKVEVWEHELNSAYYTP